MADLEKDMDDPFKAKVLNSLKELVYFNQYVKIADNPELLGETDPGWLRFAKADCDSFKKRLHKREKQYEALNTGDYEMFMRAVYDDPEFEKEQFVSSTKIEFQGDKKFLL
jgi:deoxyadenosine/deoxycytidine kinase